MRGLTMVGYLLPVLALSFAVLILNHQAVMSSIRPVKDTTQHLKRIGGVVTANQTRPKEKPRLDFIVAGFPKCVSVVRHFFSVLLLSIELPMFLLANGHSSRVPRRCSMHFYVTMKLE